MIPFPPCYRHTPPPSRPTPRNEPTMTSSDRTANAPALRCQLPP